MPYRGRIAPSPTGLLHLGHARTFWIAHQRAVAAHGTLILRIDDLDPQRSKSAYVDALIEDLTWLGIHWQEGPGANGPDSEPGIACFQSQRFPLYLAAWEQLRATGAIYPCHCSRRDLARSASAPHDDPEDQDHEPLYPGTCRPPVGTIAPAAQPSGTNWRFRVPENVPVFFTDLNLGPQRYTASQSFGDFLVWRRDDLPSYQLATVVDDAAIEISEVVRGADLLTSTARQILLNRALGYPDPAWFHCELLRDQHGQRLAKRHDALSLRTLRAQGHSPQDVLRMAGIST